ncbi:MAG: hypothetical protein OEZ19_02850 [Paracoccaceae bacterium]|nr:hypothetical protein [Paracoccaceae bacterium]
MTTERTQSPWESIALFALDFLVPLGRFMRRAEGRTALAGWPEMFWRFLPQSFFGFWLMSLIPFVGGFLYMLVLVPLSALVHARSLGAKHPSHRLMLRYFVCILIGFGGIWSAVGHLFMGPWVAGQIGWDAGSPFQTELAFASLGMGLAALLVIWIDDHLVTALVLAKSVFWFGAAGVHVYHAVVHDNFSPFNVGTPLIGDIIYPVLLLWLLYRSLGKTGAGGGT